MPQLVFVFLYAFYVFCIIVFVPRFRTHFAVITKTTRERNGDSVLPNWALMNTFQIIGKACLEGGFFTNRSTNIICEADLHQ